MSEELNAGDAEESAWEQMLRSVMGDALAEDAIRAMRAAGLDPATMANAAGLPQDREQLTAMISQIQRMLAGGGSGPVNWRLAEDLARQVAAQSGDEVVTAAEGQAVTSALRTADLWLDAVTELPPSLATARAWRRSEWAQHTLPVWKKVAEPVAASVTAALQDVLAQQAEHMPEDLNPLAAQLTGAGGMIRQLGGAVFGMQVGQAVGTLAAEAFGPTETGLPLVDEAIVALIPANVGAFADGLDMPLEEVRHFLAVREVAHSRLFAGVPWLRGHLLSAVRDYASEITIDVAAMEEAVRDLDVTDPEKLREAFSGGVFALERSEAQQAALRELETILALVEGWVEEVTSQAVAAHLPHAVPLREMIRRRRAAGGPAEQTFTTLVGLELRPRRIREAATLWSSLGTERGQAERDGLWAHPDVIPTAAELDRPLEFVSSREATAAAEADVDAALAELLGGVGDDPGTASPEASPHRTSEVRQPDPAQPGPEHHGVEQADTAQPDTAQPDTAQPDTAQPDAEQPSPGDGSDEGPGREQPGGTSAD